MKILGVDIGGTSVKVGLFTPENGLLETESFPTPLHDAQKLIDALVPYVGKWSPDLVGIGSAGSIHTDTGLVYAGNLDWWGVPLRELAEAALGLPVWVDNDANAALMAEVYDGTCVGKDTCIYLTLGTGIGGAAIINGKPWRGRTNIAMELGHMITHGDGLPCTCTRRGCFEVYASARALERMAGGISTREVIDRVKAGDAEMTDVFNGYLKELGYGLNNIVSIFCPDVIVLGGGLSKAGDILLQGAKDALHEIIIRRPEAFRGEIVLAKHGNEAGMIGAAMLAKHYLGAV